MTKGTLLDLAQHQAHNSKNWIEWHRVSILSKESELDTEGHSESINY